MTDTAKCTIRPWRLEDAADLAQLLNNKNILNNLRDGLPYPYTKKDAEDFISSMRSADPTKTFAFAITADDKVAGSIGVFRCDNIHSRTAEMGYYIGEPYWGRGLGTSAVKQVCNYIFEHTDIIRIFAEPFDYNAASCRVLEKAGFHLEGILRKNAVKNGRVLDMKMYSLVKEEMGMQVIDYYNCDRQEHWLKQIKKSDWAAGQFLYELLNENRFKDTVGEKSKVLLLVNGDELVSFCTYAEKDDIQPTELTPWMGFVYTFPKYRGHRYMEELFLEVERLAKAEKVHDVFISTGHTGLYEKYGCEFYQMMDDMSGESARVYRKHID